MRRVITMLAVVLALGAQCQTQVRIAAAANTKEALGEISKLYMSENPKTELIITYGGSGMFTNQILQGAKYDFFLSADREFAEKLAKSGKVEEEIRDYVYGRLAIYSRKYDVRKTGLEIFKNPALKRIAIANPDAAPYGRYALEVLKSQGLFEQIKSKIVYGENIGTTAQYIYTQNAEVGIIALSQIKSPTAIISGHYFMIPDELYDPIIQSCVLIKQKTIKAEAKDFRDFIFSPKAKQIWDKYGYNTKVK